MTAGSGQFSSQRAARPHLVRGGGGVAGEVADLRSDIQRDFSANAAIATEEFVDPAGADTDAIVTSIASAASETVLTGAALDGVVGGAVMSPPRNITFTTTTHADIDAVGCVVEGEDIDGNPLTETVTLTDGGNATDAGLKAFAKVETITIPAQSGTGGAIEIGFGDLIGLAKPLVSKGGAAAVLREVAAGSVVTNGTFVDAATSAPKGTYSPNTAADGSNDYALWYEYDASQNT